MSHTNATVFDMLTFVFKIIVIILISAIFPMINHGAKSFFTSFISAGLSVLSAHLFPKQYKSAVTDNIVNIWAGFWACLFLADITDEPILLLHGVATIAYGILWHQVCAQNLRTEHRRTINSKSARYCEGIIKARTIPGSDERNGLTASEARAYPNRRLRGFFGVSNCFTSTETNVCKEFREKVEHVLYVQENQWVEFAAAARMIAHRELEGKEEVSLFGFVQMVTLKTMLKVLFSIDPTRTDQDVQIRKLAHEVNVQWLRSKNDPDVESHPAWSEPGYALHDAMKAVFPDWNEQDATSNPLNLILPGYETLWRVVLRCFIEITSRGHDGAGDWQTVLQSFALNPTLAELKLSRWWASTETSNVKTWPSAEQIAQETLRLYPPTRRVYRDFKSSDGSELRAAANIEAMQRDPGSGWMVQPEIFSPERWVHVSKKEAESHYMPFGAKPFACPAKRWTRVPMPFGNAMIALLVGVILLEAEGGWELRAKLPVTWVPLDTDREAYGSAKLVIVRGGGVRE